MKIDVTNLDNLKEKELEHMHDATHAMFNQLLHGEKIDYTFRELHYLHFAIFNALIRAGGIHVSPIDQLDKIQMLEEDYQQETKNSKELIIDEIKDFNPAQLSDKDLVRDHNILHSYKYFIEEGKTIRIEGNGILDCEAIKIMHDDIVMEMLRRKIPHETPMYCECEGEGPYEVIEYGEKEEEKLWGIKIGKKSSFETNFNPTEGKTIFTLRKKIKSKGNLIEKGSMEILEEKDNLLRVKFGGEMLNDVYNFKRKDQDTEVWELSKGETKREENIFGEQLSKNEIREINFLSENNIGASEISKLLSRPVRTINGWKEKIRANKLRKK